MSDETKVEQGENVEDNSVSKPIAKPNVVCTPNGIETKTLLENNEQKSNEREVVSNLPNNGVCDSNEKEKVPAYTYIDESQLGDVFTMKSVFPKIVQHEIEDTCKKLGFTDEHELRMFKHGWYAAMLSLSVHQFLHKAPHHILVPSFQ